MRNFIKNVFRKYIKEDHSVPDVVHDHISIDKKTADLAESTRWTEKHNAPIVGQHTEGQNDMDAK